MSSEQGKSGFPCLGCCPHDLTLAKRERIDVYLCSCAIKWKDVFFLLFADLLIKAISTNRDQAREETLTEF